VRITRSSFITFLASLPIAYAARDSEDLLDPQHYRVDPYLRAAVSLQKLDRPTTMGLLHEMAQDGPSPSRLSVIILCRMLFRRRAGSAHAFRAPAIGAPTFVSGTEDDWPLWPIELFDGVPFMVVSGYTLGGLPESDESYLRYCEASCDWTDVRYAVKTDQEKRHALTSFLASDRWKQTRITEAAWLNASLSYEEFLSRQIR
jgi:hypothetical protein